MAWGRRSIVHHRPRSRQTNTTTRSTTRSSRGRRRRRGPPPPVRRWDRGGAADTSLVRPVYDRAATTHRRTREDEATTLSVESRREWGAGRRGEEWAAAAVIREANPSGEAGKWVEISASRARRESEPENGRNDLVGLWRNGGGGRFPGAWLWDALSSVPAGPKSPLGKQTTHAAPPGPTSGGRLGKQTHP
jgi:hypothetical protein